jgi:uncharacterized protein
VTGRLVYLDTSAYVKLPLQEDGHEDLRSELSHWDGYVSSMLLGVEAIRACTRYGRDRAQAARAWLQGVSLLPLDDAILDSAGELSPPALRALDAIHLATALTVKEEVGAFFSYDQQLRGAAVEQGLRVFPQ